MARGYVDASFANVLCTTSSATSAIGTTALPIFDADHGSIVLAGNTSDDISYDDLAGTFTFARDGVYHIVLSLISEIAAGNQTITTTFIQNATTRYTAAIKNTGALDPIESTHQKIISVVAGDVLHVKAVAGASTTGVLKGSAISIVEVTSGVYASNTVTTAGTTNTTAEFNPYDTDFGGGPAFAAGSQIASGVTFTGTAGSWTVPSAGKYLIMVTNIHTAAASTNSDITMHLKEGTNEIYTGAFANNNISTPSESTFTVIENLAADAVLTVTWDIAAGQCQSAVGSTITIYKLGFERSQSLARFISVVSKAEMTAVATEINPYDEDAFSSADFDTRSSAGIGFTQADGKFTVEKSGLYFVMYNSAIKASTATDVVATYKVKVGGTARITAVARVDSYPDPMSRSFNGIFDLAAGDEVTVTVTSDGANMETVIGDCIVIVRLADWLYREDTPRDLIESDYTINSFSQDCLSVQHPRHVEQVPFILGVPGVCSLRGRQLDQDHSFVVNQGKKKN
tara:strand:+ start:214 stop:1752 length:1539 start_codon:yes stop_codon:yes gene_type:complete